MAGADAYESDATNESAPQTVVRKTQNRVLTTLLRICDNFTSLYGDSVVAAALLDRLLHHAVVVHIEGSSYRLREHANLLPDHLRTVRVRLTTLLPNRFVDGQADQNGALRIAIPADHRLDRVGIFTSILLGKLRTGLTPVAGPASASLSRRGLRPEVLALFERHAGSETGLAAIIEPDETQSLDQVMDVVPKEPVK